MILVAYWFWQIHTQKVKNQHTTFMYTMYCVSIFSTNTLCFITYEATSLASFKVAFFIMGKLQYFSHFVNSVFVRKFLHWMSMYCKHFIVISYLCLYHRTIKVRVDAIWLYWSLNCIPDQHKENEKLCEIPEGRQRDCHLSRSRLKNLEHSI